jgi:hypothetical protein
LPINHKEGDRMDVLELNDADRRFLRSVGIQVPEDAAWPIDDEKLTYDQALAVLGRAMKQKHRETDATGFADPEAI